MNEDIEKQIFMQHDFLVWFTAVHPKEYVKYTEEFDKAKETLKEMFK